MAHQNLQLLYREGILYKILNREGEALHAQHRRYTYQQEDTYLLFHGLQVHLYSYYQRI